MWNPVRPAVDADVRVPQAWDSAQSLRRRLSGGPPGRIRRRRDGHLFAIRDLLGGEHAFPEPALALEQRLHPFHLDDVDADAHDAHRASTPR